jgi:hypothetical protein
MKACKPMVIVFLMLAVSVASFAASQAPLPEDSGWPRVFEANGNQLVVYQPQVDFWKDYQNLHFRCAIAVKTAASKKETLGVAEVEAETVTNHTARVVAVMPKKRELRFPNTSDKEAASLKRVVDELSPPGRPLTVSLDRVLAYLDPDQQPQQRAVELSLDPPKIFYSDKPAILLMFMGEPQFKPVSKDKTDVMFAVNTNWDVFYDTTGQRYYLLNKDNWLAATNAVTGPWTPAGALPAGISALPPDDNWADVRQQVPGKQGVNPPVVFATTEPAELLLTNGEPSFSPVGGTKLMRVANTDMPLFLFSGDKRYYLLISGRWFKAAGLGGPWTPASQELPGDFARIPDHDPSAFVKASVPGTVEARDAVLLASIPATTSVDVSSPPAVEVSYSGAPTFQPIPNTTVQYAVNSPNSVFLVNGGYYCCDRGVWFCGAAATGPWTYCTSVPSAIYGIPASHPAHNVTYVTVQSSTPTTVVYSQTAGYSGEYVAATGVLMFGAGMIVGAIIADHHDDDYYPPYVAHYSYGCGARFSYAYGGYYRAAGVSYGPYGGAGAAAVYNPRTGTYSRGAHAYGPAGSATVRQAYNPYTGARAGAAWVDTAYGSAGRFRAYNPATGTAARSGYRSSDYGTVGGVKTNRGTGAVAWDTQQGQGVVVKGKENVYAGKDGTVYKRDDDGNWSSNSGSGWESVSKPQPKGAAATTTTTTSGGRAESSTSRGQAPPTAQARQTSTAPTNVAARESVQSLERNAQSRQRGNQLSQTTRRAPSTSMPMGGNPTGKLRTR